MRRWAVIGGGIAVGLAGAAALLALAGADPSSGDRIESHPWESAVVSDDGRSMVVSFTGAEEFPEDDPCHVDYSVEVAEGPRQVRLTVEGRESRGTRLCTLAGMFRALTAELSQPLAQRQVVDGHEGRINPVRTADGRCLQPPIRRPSSSNASAGVSSTSTLVPPPPPVDACDV